MRPGRDRDAPRRARGGRGRPAGWLGEEKSRVWLQSHRGVGPKTVDYLRLLVGEPACAVDRHLYRFLAEAGLDIADYATAHAVIDGAAAVLGIDGRDFDHSIWRRMSKRAQRTGQP